ncbi:MAG: RNA 2',3'-cyclic phosphodiesterase [Nitrospinales bacterium]
MAQTIRAFIAIDPPPPVIQTIAEIQDRFKTLGLDASWVKPKNIHLTLRFLGNISPQQISEIKLRLAETASEASAFEFSLSHIGVFPNLKRPRVLWVGLENPDNSLEALQKKVDGQIQALGFPPESKQSVPHLTLARIKSRRNTDGLRREIESAGEIASGPMKVSSIKLYQSRLTPRGSLYTVLGNFTLKS